MTLSELFNLSLGPFHLQLVAALSFIKGYVFRQPALLCICRLVILGCHDWSTIHFYHPSRLLERWEFGMTLYYSEWSLIYLHSLCSTLIFFFDVLAWMDGSWSSSQWAVKWEVSCSLNPSCCVFKLSSYLILSATYFSSFPILHNLFILLVERIHL